ncbi:hypothetical protein M408DRAFT_231463 [Serendipita vermifera MAFF 305830]|uniref:Phosphatidylethanolamine N-methyltransferase n=1 Tax=Serendipita vermifera MAFF 305830 TaxID=933852 RepID=A0A0C3AJ27_SERVB|nr:hypothetical protein M408DRAFT_231463 [Serendipita vermifera MAFF 305830]
MSQPLPGLRKRHVGLGENGHNDAQNATNPGENYVNGAGSQSSKTEHSKGQTVWGKTNSGTVFRVPTTHDVLTLFHPGYPKSHFDMLSLFLLGSQILVFFGFLLAHQNNPLSHQQSHAKWFFVLYFVFWRTMYDAGLGWVLTKQSKKRWIVKMVVQRGWFDEAKRPKVRAWLRKQLEGKMGKDYAFDDLPVEYNTWLLFRQVVDIILLNDFLSYVLFAICNLDFLFPVPNATASTQGSNAGMILVRLIGGAALLLFNLWVKTSAHDVVKDYGWYWGDCFFSRGHLRQTESNASGTDNKELQFDLVFDGIFEMAPHPMYSVGYAGYYGVSLLSASYPVLFVSLAAHAAQFAFLNFFENPHIERRYGVRKLLAERTPVTIRSQPVRVTDTTAETLAIDEDALSMATRRSRSESMGTTTAIDSEEGSSDLGIFDTGLSRNNSSDAAIISNVTPPSGAREMAREAVTQHDLLNKFFRKDVIVLSGLDLLRASDQLILLLTGYVVLLIVLPLLNLSSQTMLTLHFVHAACWRIYYSVILGLVLKAQSDSKWVVRHFLEHYHYAPLSLTDSPKGSGDRGVIEGAVKEAFENWKGMYNLGMLMCYLSFFGFAAQTYHLPAVWTVGDVLLRHTVGALLVALHIWAASESYEVLGIFGWFFGDFFIDDYPASLNYTGIYRFLNNPERTMSGAALFGVALITGNKAVFVLALLGHFTHSWFLSWVEGPHMRKLYGESLRKDAGFTKMLKKLAKRNAKLFEGVRKQINIMLQENSLTGKHAPEIARVAKGVMEVGERIGEVYSESSEMVEEVWNKSRPRISDVVAETRALLKQSRERFVIPLLARDLADYDHTKYNMYVVPTNPDGQLRFHWGEPINVIWRSPLRHSRRDWVGIYRYGANQSQVMTKTSTLGLWVPVHDEEWDGDVPRPLTDRNEGEETECGEITFKNSTLPWQTGDYELRYHHDGKYNVVALIGPIQVYLDRPDALDFKSIRQWLLKIVYLALDSDPDLIPKSQAVSTSFSPEIERRGPILSREMNMSTSSIETTMPSTSGTPGGSTPGGSTTSYDIHDDDFRFWSERQAKRISYAISQVLSIDFAPEVIVADANVTALTRRILASKELLGP